MSEDYSQYVPTLKANLSKIEQSMAEYPPILVGEPSENEEQFNEDWAFFLWEWHSNNGTLRCIESEGRLKSFTMFCNARAIMCLEANGYQNLRRSCFMDEKIQLPDSAHHDTEGLIFICVLNHFAPDSTSDET